MYEVLVDSAFNQRRRDEEVVMSLFARYFSVKNERCS